MNLKFNFAKNYFFQSFGVLFLVVISICFANGQSRDIKNPTPLATNEISGIVTDEPKGNTYYYSFWVNPGELNISLRVEHNPNDNRFFLLTSVGFRLLESNGKELANITATTKSDYGSVERTAKVEITKRQLMILSVKIYTGESNGIGNALGGKYRLGIGGSAFTNTASNTNSSSNPTSSDEVTEGGIRTFMEVDFPQNGFLQIVSNEGSSVLIDFQSIKSVHLMSFPKSQRNLSKLTSEKIDLPKVGDISITLKTAQGRFSFDLSKIKTIGIFHKADDINSIRSMLN